MDIFFFSSRLFRNLLHKSKQFQQDSVLYTLVESKLLHITFIRYFISSYLALVFHVFTKQEKNV